MTTTRRCWAPAPLRGHGRSCQIGAMARTPSRPARQGIDEIVTIEIELIGSDPLIWRRIEVPTSATLQVLHGIVQIVMGWFDSHLWEFRADGQRYGFPVEDDGDWGGSPRGDPRKVRLRDLLKPGRTIIDYLY